MVLATAEQRNLRNLNSTMVEVHSIATIAIIMQGNLKSLPTVLIIIDRATANITATVTISIKVIVPDCNYHKAIAITIIVTVRMGH